ncbi:MAG: sigma-54-dependent Fis family transcriptional regulator [Chitinophagaceae bacterium]|nr:MAG: sigma-54-dependent Fis family transcriptional regulator [Chitinophagaceae bacterium]
MNKVLIIDDEEKIRTLLSKIIELEGFEVVQAPDIKFGLKKLETNLIDVVLCDVKLPDGNGIRLAETIKQKFPSIEVILLTAYGNIPDGVQAMKNGAFDYITKGDDNNRIIPLIYKAVEKVALSRRVLQLEKQLGKKYSFETILGKSKQIRAAIESARKVAATDASVLLTGETGTGKEVFAQAIHSAGLRAKQNFIAVNCSALSPHLLENELFGHKAGAYTGAINDSKGIFEEANKGTVFLDEIGEMPLELQAKLLRILETGEFLKVGDNKPTKTDVRIIAATHRNLQTEVETRHFREDLYYRIAVFQIVLPSLKERLSDIEQLATFFLQTFSLKSNKKITGLSPAYLDALLQHPWKGNIRELKNLIERSIILTDEGELQPDSLPAELQYLSKNGSGVKLLSAFELASAEKVHIQKVLNYANGNKTETARLLNIALTTLYRKLEEFGIK